jgi:hypothetical protein
MSLIAMERVLDAFLQNTTETALSDGVAANFFGRICNIYDLKHASYISVDKRSLTSRQPKVFATYPMEWQREYRRSFFETRDPILKFGRNAMIPFDWHDGQVLQTDSDLLNFSRT